MRTFLVAASLLGAVSWAATAPTTLSPCTGVPHTFVVEVASTDGRAVQFDGAVAADGDLRILDDATTPQRLEIVAAKLIATFKAADGGKLSASLYSREGGEDRRVGHTVSASPAIYESVSCEEPLIRAFGSF